MHTQYILLSVNGKEEEGNKRTDLIKTKRKKKANIDKMYLLDRPLFFFCLLNILSVEGFLCKARKNRSLRRRRYYHRRTDLFIQLATSFQCFRRR